MLEGELKRHEKVYLVIDALDECPSQARLELLKRLSDLQKAHAQIQVLMSTRDIDVMTEDVIQNFSEMSSMKLVADKKDLQIYIQTKFNTRARLRDARRHSELVEDLTRMLIDKAEGM